MRDLDLSRYLSEGLAGLSAYTAPEGGGRVRLDANECPWPPERSIIDQITRALGEEPLNRYPDPLSAGLREAFAERFHCHVENVVAGNGSDELIGLLLWTLRGNPGQGPPAVVVPTPTFAMYALGARAAGYEVHEVPLGAGLEPDMAGLLEAVREVEPSIVFLSNPNNPTGTFYSEEQVRQVLEASAGLVVVDEAYGDYAGEASWVPAVKSIGNLAVLRTLSKVGAAALRCGFLAAGSRLLEEVNKVRFPFNVSRHTQVAGEIFLRNYDATRPRTAEIVAQRDRMTRELENCGCRVYPSKANFLLVQCGGREEALWRFLLENGIVVKFMARLPVTGDALRITAGTPDENNLLISRTRDFLTEGGKDA